MPEAQGESYARVNTAKVIWREERLESLQVSADELQPIRFQGQSFDTETGLHYNRFRYFDPDLGMFTTRDPIGLMGGMNVFQYAPNPVGWIDPFGLSACSNTRATRAAKFDEIMADLDKWALVPISGRQKRMIKDKLSTIKQRSVKANRLIRKKGFSKKQENALIAKWEKETGQAWPSGATPHHIIPLKNGGSNEWWNLAPVKHPHTGTIHGTGSALRTNLPYSLPTGTITELI